MRTSHLLLSAGIETGCGRDTPEFRLSENCSNHGNENEQKCSPVSLFLFCPERFGANQEKGGVYFGLLPRTALRLSWAIIGPSLPGLLMGAIPAGSRPITRIRTNETLRLVREVHGDPPGREGRGLSHNTSRVYAGAKRSDDPAGL